MFEIGGDHKIKKPRSKPRVLFMGENVTLAHVTRPIVLAKSLDKEEYEVLLAAGEGSASLVESAGLDYVRIHTIPSSVFVERVTKANRAYTVDEYDSYVKEDLKLIEKVSPDLIVSDWRLSVPVCGDILGTPIMMIANAHWSPYSTQPPAALDVPLVRILGYKLTRSILMPFFRSISKYYVQPYNVVRKSYGLKLLNSVDEMNDCAERCLNWFLYLDTPSLAPTDSIPHNHAYIGPPIWSPDVPLPDWWEDLPSDRSVLYLSLGSSGDVKRLSMIFDVLGSMPVTVIFATAGRYDIKSVSDNCYAVEYLPGVDACRRSDVVLCNGGKGSIYQAFSAGKPVLGMSSNWDQYMAMEPVERQKAGILIRSMQMSRKRIRDSIEELISNEEFVKSAEKLRDEIMQYNAQERFRECVDSVWED
ncbi:PGL/p-HBAD biosynthesis glycosyltransferase [subsurface metagenome]